jgi:hypothetical protein
MFIAAPRLRHELGVMTEPQPGWSEAEFEKSCQGAIIIPAFAVELQRQREQKFGDYVRYCGAD